MALRNSADQRALDRLHVGASRHFRQAQLRGLELAHQEVALARHLAQRGPGRRERRRRRKATLVAQAREHGGIDAIGLVAHPQALGVVMRAKRIDDGRLDGLALPGDPGRQLQRVTARGLHAGAQRRRRRQRGLAGMVGQLPVAPVQPGRHALGRALEVFRAHAGDGPRRAVGLLRQIQGRRECVLGHIQAAPGGQGRGGSDRVAHCNFLSVCAVADCLKSLRPRCRATCKCGLGAHDGEFGLRVDSARAVRLFSTTGSRSAPVRCKLDGAVCPRAAKARGQTLFELSTEFTAFTKRKNQREMTTMTSIPFL